MDDAAAKRPDEPVLSQCRRYGFALGTLLIGLALRLALAPLGGDHGPFLPLYLAVALGAWYGGPGPGLVTTLAGGVMDDFLWSVPHHTLFPGTWDAAMPLFVYLCGGMLLSGFAESLHRERRRADGRAAALRQEREALRASEEHMRRIRAQARCPLWSAEVEDRGGELLHREMKLADPEAARQFFPLNARSAEDYQQAWYFNRPAEDRLRTDLLELVGCPVAVAGSGPEALAAAPSFQPEVVLCDLGLRGVDGYDVAADLRRLPVTANTCLIAISGYGQEEDRRRSQTAGFDRHLTKPIDFAELRKLLELTPGVPADRRGDEEVWPA
jgi:CheY-like chemotaxis protein